jgi:hypothetical protein
MSLTWDVSELNKLMGVYASMTKRTLPEVVRETARLFCQDMVNFTPPFSEAVMTTRKGGLGGFGNKARDKGRASVARDIDRIFMPLSEATARDVASAKNVDMFREWVDEKKAADPSYKGGKFARLFNGPIWDISNTRIMEAMENAVKSSRVVHYIGSANESQLHIIHKQVRGGTDVPYKVNKSQRMKEVWVLDNVGMRSVESYKRQVQKHVGRLKAGWYFAGMKMNTRNLKNPMPTSAWIAQQLPGNEIASVSSGEGNFVVTIGNKIGRNFHDFDDTFERAKKHRAYVMTEEIQRILTALTRKGTLEVLK